MSRPIEEVDLLEHTVLIDEYTTLNLSLPKKLDALDLMATLQRLTKILKITTPMGSIKGKYKTRLTGTTMWKPEEDAIITEAAKTFQGKKMDLWDQLATQIEGRTTGAIQMRWRVLTGKK